VSTDETRAIAQRFAQVWFGGSPSIVDELADPNLTVYYPVIGQPIRGAQAFKQVLEMVHAALPDADGSVDEVIAEGDRAVIRWTLRGTHRGDLLGIPPTGRRVEWTGISIYRLANGKVVEEQGEEDALGLMRQLGVIPEERPAAA
jgi:steroid delta-isomerase-like uncharacterized protein